MIGVIVDAVSEVLTLQGSEIEDTPDFGNGVATPYLLGMAKIKGKVKILLDIDRVLSTQEVSGLLVLKAGCSNGWRRGQKNKRDGDARRRIRWRAIRSC